MFAPAGETVQVIVKPKNCDCMHCIKSRLVKSLVLLLFVVAISSGCGVNRISTTEKTAVERALVVEAVEEAVNQVELQPPHNRSFFMETVDPLSHFQKAELGLHLIEGLVSKRLIELGLRRIGKRENADYIVIPTLHFASVDDNSMVLGVPSFPIPLGGNVINTPEISLLSLKKQFGRAKVSVQIIDRPDGAVISNFESGVAEKKYHRWSFLILFGWRVTDLPEPF